MQLLTVFMLGVGLMVGEPDTIQLDHVHVVSDAPTRKVDHSESQSQFAESLQQLGLVYARHYPGGIATLSFRGMTASHTNFSWNGLRVNSSTLGDQDISLIPVNFFDQINLQTQQQSDDGLQAAGGNVTLADPLWNRENVVSYRVMQGSRGLSQHTLKVKTSGKRWASLTKFDRAAADNDYQYISPLDQQIYRLQNAAYERYNLAQAIRYHGQNFTIGGRYWATWKDQQLSPSLLQAESKRNQTDAIHRLQMHGEVNYGNHLTEWMIGAIAQDQHYHDELIELHARNQEHSYQGVLKHKWQSNASLAFKGTIRVEHNQGSTDGYAKWRTQNRMVTELRTIKSWRDERHQLTGYWRGESMNENWFFDGGGITYTYLLNEKWTAEWAGSAIHRFPTLNALYWNPGGNEALQPEFTKGMEISFQHGSEGKTAKVTGFAKTVDDWIQWLPSSAGYWRAMNIAKVRSLGVDFESTFKGSVGAISWQTDIRYCFVSVMNQWVEYTIVPTRKQFIYVPHHTGALVLTSGYKHWTVQFAINGASKRYTSIDNSASLPGYALIDATLTRHPAAGLSAIEYGVYVNNLANTTYELVAWRPMPMRNAGVFLNWNWKK